MSDGFVTVAQCVEGLPAGRWVWEALVCAFLAWFLLGAINECSPLAFSLVAMEWQPTEQSVAIMSAALALGNFLSIFIGGYVADRYGRMSVVRPALVLTVASGVLVQSAKSFWQAAAARFVLGLVSGSLMGVMPPLIAEHLPSKSRGFYLTVWCCGWPAGALFAVGVGCLVPELNWRAFYTLMLAPAVLLYVCTRAEMLSESPRYLYLAGRRDEGYNILIDMYERENLPLPWGADTIAVTCNPQRSHKQNVSASTISTMLWLALAMLCVSAAAQSMKLWMPTMLVAHEADKSYTQELDVVDMSRRAFNFAAGPQATSLLNLVRAPLMSQSPNYHVAFVLAQAYVVELIGIIVCAYISTSVCRRIMVQWSLLAAAVLTLIALATAGSGLSYIVGPIVGLQLAAQSTGLNFLQVFASEHFPTSRRAKTTAFVNFSGQFGNFTIPALGGFLVRWANPALAVVFFSVLYIVGWLITFRLQLPTGPEKPLLDVDEPSPSREGTTRPRKREWTTYDSI